MTHSLRITNARIWTGDDARPWCESLTIRDGRIAALDDQSDLDSALPGIDAGGRTVTPGLIDAHMHLLIGARGMDQLDLSRIDSREEFEEAIARRHAELPPGEWLIACGWADGHFQGSLAPDKDWLAPAGDRPVVCYGADLHSVLVNDAVLRRCDLNEDPPGGRIVRDQTTGEPRGVLLEAAAWELVNPVVPKPDVHARRRQLLAAQAHCHRLGLTTVGAMEYGQDVMTAYEPTRDNLTLRCRIVLLDRQWPLDFSYGRAFSNDDHLAVIGYKAFLDGAFRSRTARMLEDYADDPGNRGLLVELAADGHLHEWAQAVAREGFSPVMHAIGDEAVRMVLDVVEKLPNEVRPRIEHAQHIAAEDMPRFADLLVSMQPEHKADDGRYAELRLGPERMPGMFAFRSLIDAGARLAFGSDWPAASCDPLIGMRSAVTGLTYTGGSCLPEQNLTVEEALTAYTAGAAYTLRMEDAGVIKPGAFGDVVMFDRDPFEADWENQPPNVAMTVVGGKVVYDRSDE